MERIYPIAKIGARHVPYYHEDYTNTFCYIKCFNAFCLFRHSVCIMNLVVYSWFFIKSIFI